MVVISVYSVFYRLGFGAEEDVQKKGFHSINKVMPQKKYEIFLLSLIDFLPDRELQSYEPNPGKQTQPHSEHWPFQLHRLGHFSRATTSWCSCSLLLFSISLLSHSFSSSGNVAFSHDVSSFSCRSETHIDTAWLIMDSSSKRRQPNARLEFATARWH